MSSQSEKQKVPTKARISWLLALCLLAGLLWGANWFLVARLISQPVERGQFGDMFGAVNALFTALAFAGLIYTVLLQRDQLELQQRELTESGETQSKLVRDQIEAQQQLFEQRKNHDLKMEELRERFYELAEERRKARREQETNEFRANVLRAFRSELEVMGRIYDEGIGSMLALAKEGQPFLINLALTEDWFTIFSANAPQLGKLEGQMANRIIAAYGMLKMLVETYRVNNEYITRWEEYELRLKMEPKDVYFLEKQRHLRSRMVFQVGQIKKAETGMRSAVRGVIELLDERGIS